MIDTIRGTIAYVTAAIVAVGAPILAYMAWLQPVVEGRDLAILFAFFGITAGGAAQFLFGAEVRTQAAKSAERSAEKALANQPTISTGGQPPRTTISPPHVVEDDGA